MLQIEKSNTVSSSSASFLGTFSAGEGYYVSSYNLSLHGFRFIGKFRQTKFNNADKEFLQSLPHKDKVEILANCSCVSGCTRKKDHYIDASQAQIDCFSTDASKEKEFCTRYASNFFEAKSRRDWLTYEDLRERVDMGFNNFKIEGRDALFNPSMVFTLIETYTHYFIKPEFKDMFRYELACRAVDAGVFEHCGNW